jgi:hypothetical protein
LKLRFFEEFFFGTWAEIADVNEDRDGSIASRSK